ncbi:MAG: hypothetical protein IPO78_16000 [Saprospiraceae bacterium]|nr:hypothetical protein [Saprospiraceae bacterium]
MATNENNSKKVVDLMAETQAKIVDQAIEATKKLTKEIPFVNETLDKGHQFIKDSISAQADFIEKASQTSHDTQKDMNSSSENAKNYFEQWFENQMTWAKTFYNQNQNPAATGFGSNPSEWMNTMQNWMNQNNSYWMQNLNKNPSNPMMHSNPFMNDGMNQWNQYSKQYFDMMNNGYSDWWKQFPNTTAADSFKGMHQMAESVSKFYELWIPMFKSIQHNNFNMDIFKQNLNPEKYKEFVDKFFHFMPEGSRKIMDQMNQTFIESMKQMSETGLGNYHGFKSQMNSNPWSNTNPFNQMLDLYTNWRNSMSEAVSPLSKLLEENSNVKSAKVWNDIYDQMIQFNIKNNELQYMMYQNGLKVMERVAENVAEKIQKGERIESILKVYQDWLIKGDEVYGNLFQSDEYSKLMTEVSSLQMKIKQAVDKQIEKLFFANLPIATRTEMDEVYKSIYDLKKMVRQLERKLNPEPIPVEKNSKNN